MSSNYLHGSVVRPALADYRRHVAKLIGEVFTFPVAAHHDLSMYVPQLVRVLADAEMHLERNGDTTCGDSFRSYVRLLDTAVVNMLEHANGIEDADEQRDVLTSRTLAMAAVADGLREAFYEVCSECYKMPDDCECERCENCGETDSNCSCQRCDGCGRVLECSHCGHVNR